MRIIAVAAFAVLSCMHVLEVRAQWPQATYNCHGWYFEAGTRILDRPGARDDTPVVTANLTGATILTAEEASDLGTSAGIHARFGWQNACSTSWEARWFYQPWRANVDVVGVNLASPFVPGIPLEAIGINYTSDLFSAEFNARRSVMAGVTLLAGPRFVYLEEQMTIGAFDIPLNGFTGDLDTIIGTSNQLYGGHIGVELNMPVSRDLYLTGFVRSGGFANFAKFDTETIARVANFDFTVNEFRERQTRGAFVGEVGGRINYDIFPGAVSLYVGYEATWIDGVAVAPAQLRNDLAAIHTDTTIFFHGVVLGGSIRR